MAEQRNPYRILGVPVGANKATIEAAYRRLARRYHPDLNVDPDATARMQDINWARDVLLDPHRRYHWSQYTHSDRRPYARYTHSYTTTRARTQTRTQTRARERPTSRTWQRQADRDGQERGTPYTSGQKEHRNRTRRKPPLWARILFGDILSGSLSQEELEQRINRRAKLIWTIYIVLCVVLVFIQD